MGEQTYLVEMRGVTKDFPGVRALAGVDFRLRSGGELRGLVGKNGAGKSTLMNVLTGVYPCDAGEILVRGKSYPRMTTTLSRQLGIACVHQHSQLVGPLSIAENVFCGDLPTGRLGLVDWDRVHRGAQERLGQLGLDIDVRRKVEGLSVAERQIIEIAKALFAEAQVIVLDEATAPLPKNDVELLFGFVRRQRQRGAAFVYISHYLEEIFELCENVTVMRDGRSIGDYPVSALTPESLIRAISGVEVERFRHASAAAGGVPVLSLRGLTRPGAYASVTLSLAKGEVVGLTGLEGCGKDALARGLFGLEPMGSGEVLLEGKPYRASDPRQALDRGVAYLPRDRHGLGIIGPRPILENITLPILSRLNNAIGLLSRRRESELVSRLISSLDVATPSSAQPVEFLSGGNQQKVVFAKLVSAGPRVLLLDEPTQGVDVQAKVEIMKIIDRLAREQEVATVVISEEIRELLDVCDRILVMFRGSIVAEFRARDPGTTVERILGAVEGAAQ
ncbi:MAG TPA: sugar ABC transporter ATP-binding protein [Anaeromyxobacter sp.]|nr:sugar ABC transporter ATP-binding protein [Anaeromyxobacter sp.]